MTFLFGILFIIGCDNSTAPETPESATISGTITFTGTWPTSGEVTVSLNAMWPPQGAPAAYAVITSSDVVNDTYTYTFENVTFGTYPAIAVAHDNGSGNPATSKTVLGAYGGSAIAYFGDATSTTVSTTEYTVTGLNFTSDLSLVP
tara:strand:+ start:767 stop:1204 length:438 start_codon:yes stop_codon:yes gene_type:complete